MSDVATPTAPVCSRLVRVKHTGAATATVLIEADNASVREAADGRVIIELFRYGDRGTALESFQLHLCRLDRQRLRGKI